MVNVYENEDVIMMWWWMWINVWMEKNNLHKFNADKIYSANNNHFAHYAMHKFFPSFFSNNVNCDHYLAISLGLVMDNG